MFNAPTSKCYCGSEHSFQKCCEKFIENSQLPDTPEQLMRSRYTAYRLKDEDYLLKTWHESTRPETLDLKEDSTQWLKLKIISARDSSVHFVAYFMQDSLNKEKIYALTEESHFSKERNWFYLDGADVKTVQLTKNMVCPCQSGKKYKRCCGKDF